MRAMWLPAAMAAVGFGCSDDLPLPAGSVTDVVATDVGDTGGTDGAGDTATGDPGILIRASMASKIGVLLDEFPEGAFRDRVATALMAKDDEFWKARAENQIELTHYRLTFREYFYEEGEGKKSLTLPPPSVWKIDIDEKGAQRVTVDGHDYVAVDYTMNSVIVTDLLTPLDSDGAFAAVGGKAEESFVLPLDPELVLQRSGFACIDEAEFPPSSVDAENVATYYDDGCTAVEDAPIKERCHSTVEVTEDCVDALEAHIGRAETTISFERVAWSEAEAAPYRVGEWTSTTGVDVQPVVEALEHNYIVYKYIGEDDCAVVEKCVGGTGWRRLLRFDAFLKNTGTVDMEIGDVDYFIASTAGDATLLGQHNIFEYSACHDHYHFKYYGQFDLDVGDETVVGSKRAFCLETGTRHFNNEQTPTTTNYSGCHFQGLTRGWGDEYGANLDCQWYDITDVDTSAGPVAADIGFKANPNGFMCEGNPVLDEKGGLTFTPSEFTTDDGEPVDKPVCEYIDGWQDNNNGSLPTTLPKSGGLVTEPCMNGTVGPLRDCGFTAGPLAACEAGKAATLTCTNSATEPAVVRLCESSAKLGTGVACVYRDSLANTVVLPGAATTEVAFKCPASRDAAEPGGQYALYSAPVWEADTLGTISCTLKK